MTLLTNIWQRPMLIWVIVPLIVLLLWVAILAWESRLPPEKKMLRKIRDAHARRQIAKHKPSAHH